MNLHNRTFRASPSKVGRICGQVVERSRRKHPALGLVSNLTLSDTGNHWILLKLVGKKSNRMGIGAQIHITTEDGLSQWNGVTTAVGYTASSDSRVHFGLGKNRVIKDVEIRWPSGIKQMLHQVAADQMLTVEEPQS